MNIIRKGYVYNNVRKEYTTSIEQEILCYSLLSLGFDKLIAYFKSHTIIPLFRVFVLNDDETIKHEISEYVLNGNIDINKQQGQTRSANLTLDNSGNTFIYGTRGNLYEGLKIRIDSGVVVDNVLYWTPQGIFLIKEPTFQGDISSRTIGISLCDKWGIWDGSVWGKTGLKTIIPVDVSMQQAFDTIAHESNGVSANTMWELKPVLFDSSCSGYKTFHTLKQDAGQTKADLYLDMAKTISADLYYNIRGNMCVKSNSLDFKNANYSPVWRFDEGDIDCTLPTLKYNKSNYYNKITTKGAILNGYQFSASIENKNKKSLYNVYDVPITPKVNNNSKLYSDTLCLEQCMYEMVNQSRGLMSATMTCTFLPFLDIDKMINLSFPSIGVKDEQFIIDGISYNLGTDCKMNLKMTSNNEVIF